MVDSGRKLIENPINSSDHVVQNLGLEAMNFDFRTKQKPALNHDIFRSWNGKQIHLKDEGKESGLFLSPQRSPQYYRSNFHNLSPSSKSQAIASGHRELMEMVSQMPESCYELSLRDLVEQPMGLGLGLGREEEILKDEKGFNMSSNREFLSRESGKNKKESRPLISRSNGLRESGGVYLKMGFPKSLGTAKKKKKKNESVINSSAKVSPKPPLSTDKEGWKKRFSLSSESESVKSSSSRSSSGGSSNNRGRRTSRKASGGCWSWMFTK